MRLRPSRRRTATRNTYICAAAAPSPLPPRDLCQKLSKALDTKYDDLKMSEPNFVNVADDSVFVSKEWLLQEPRKTLAKVNSQLSLPLFRDRVHPYIPIFFKRAAITMIYASNMLERTLPLLSSAHETYKLLNALYDVDSDDLHAAPPFSWNAEGENLREISAQMIQHLRALKFLMNQVKNSLTVDVVLKTHEVLMKGAVDDSGVFIKNGTLRDHPCHAGTHVYPDGDPAALRASLIQIIEKYNASMREVSPALVEPATILFYSTITLHPFQNGNGRLCRLLFAFAIIQAGAPFPVALTTGHSGARKHYMKAILLARRGNCRELATMALMSVDYSLSNCLENIHLTNTPTLQ
jgi:Fic family protein